MQPLQIAHQLADSQWAGNSVREAGLGLTKSAPCVSRHGRPEQLELGLSRAEQALLPDLSA